MLDGGVKGGEILADLTACSGLSDLLRDIVGFRIEVWIDSMDLLGKLILDSQRSPHGNDFAPFLRSIGKILGKLRRLSVRTSGNAVLQVEIVVRHNLLHPNRI